MADDNTLSKLITLGTLQYFYEQAIGRLSELQTEDKTSIVDAINEILDMTATEQDAQEYLEEI